MVMNKIELYKNNEELILKESFNNSKESLNDISIKLLKKIHLIHVKEGTQLNVEGSFIVPQNYDFFLHLNKKDLLFKELIKNNKTKLMDISLTENFLPLNNFFILKLTINNINYKFYLNFLNIPKYELRLSNLNIDRESFMKDLYLYRYDFQFKTNPGRVSHLKDGTACSTESILGLLEESYNSNKKNSFFIFQNHRKDYFVLQEKGKKYDFSLHEILPRLFKDLNNYLFENSLDGSCHLVLYDNKSKEIGKNLFKFSSDLPLL